MAARLGVRCITTGGMTAGQAAVLRRGGASDILGGFDAWMGGAVVAEDRAGRHLARPDDVRPGACR